MDRGARLRAGLGQEDVLEFRILGPLEVVEGDRILPLGGEKQRAALAMLLLHRNVVVSRDRLIEGIWGDAPPVSAGPTLDTLLSRLRKVLPTEGSGSRLVTRPPGYLLRVEDGELDLQRFEVLLDRARSALASEDRWTSGEHLREALSLFRGTSLEDLAHAPFAQAEVGRLEEMRLGALELRLDVDLESGRYPEVVGELESLVARYPFRERFWAQLMLALYRSGRQGDALMAFDRARRTLSEELGVDPGQPLQQLQRRILQQDPSLEPARATSGVGTPTGGLRPGSSAPPDADPSSIPMARPSVIPTPSAPAARVVSGRRRWPPRARTAAIAAASLTVLAVLVAVLPRADRTEGGESPATFRPGVVLLDLTTGKERGFIPPSDLAVAAYPIFADGHFWVNDWDPNAYVEIDPREGKILKHLDPPARDPNVLADFATLTPFAVDGNTLWVTAADDLVKMDIELSQEVGRFRLDDIVKGESGVAEGVAVGAGSVWVSRDVGRGQIVRLDPATGRVEHVWDEMTPSINLAFGDGSLWAADERGIARIDPDTNLVIKANDIGGNQMVAAGGGFGWTSDDAKGVVYKVDSGGRLVATYDTGLGATFMAYTDGVLWVGNQDEGTVTGIDAVTGTFTTHRFGHPVATIAAGDGVLLAYLGAGRSVEDHIDALTGKVARFFAHEGQLGQGDEPALNTDPGAYQIAFATCAKLLNYPDQPAPEGWQLQPEIAAAMPTVSPDGRTYTFTVRSGYRFSPPFDESVTAETFRFSIERALSPGLAQDPPGPHFIRDIEGEQAFRLGEAEHISGLRAKGDALSITLVRPSPDFLHRLALPFFCPVPVGTPFGPHGLTNGAFGGARIPSAGPYYVAEYSNEDYVILKRNPNYHGPRPQAFDAIAIREGVDASAAVDRVQNEGWDGITSLSGPELDPEGPLDQRWGPGSSAASEGDQRYFLTPRFGTRFIAFNSSRGIFADERVRRAAALAIDRDALAAAWAEVPTDQLLPPTMSGPQEQVPYPRSGSISEAEALMPGRTGHAVMAIPSGCDRCPHAAQVVRANLLAIGIEVRVREVDDLRAALRSGAEFDLVDAITEILYPDSGSFLAQMLRDVPRGWAPASVQRRIGALAGLGGDARGAAASDVAEWLVSDEFAVAAYGTPQTSQFVGPGIGCAMFTSFGYGLDLASLCLNASVG